MPWTDDDKAAAIRAFFENGETAGTIAKRHGTTRNAVLGLMHRHRARNGIAARVPVGPKARKPEQRAPRKPATARKAVPLVAEMAAIGVRLVPWPKLPGGLPIGDLGAGECRFAITPHDARKSEHRFCGAPADGSFCPHHARIVFSPKPE